mmetsp:Transcript_36394/g.36787  ORF Transcript_36394/g.36787 Transcript_36394/m.36787 type:complete len:102 (-) Transcript_36394:28-333(-)
MNHRSSLLLVLGIFILIVVAANLMFLPSIVSTNGDSSDGDVMAEFAVSNNELSYTNRSSSVDRITAKDVRKWSQILQKKEQKEGVISSSSSSSLRRIPNEN